MDASLALQTGNPKITVIVLPSHYFLRKGVVFGNCWGGGKCGYATIKLGAKTRQELMDEIEKCLKDKSLDFGMGFESLTGAVVQIEEQQYLEREIQIPNAEFSSEIYTHSVFEIETVGTVTDEEMDIAIEQL
jgi:hypothetical protein